MDHLVAMDHCIRKIVEIVDRGSDDRRSILQLGYNLGRLSEVTGLGREPFWDTWKDAVAIWDLSTLKVLAASLPEVYGEVVEAKPTVTQDMGSPNTTE